MLTYNVRFVGMLKIGCWNVKDTSLNILVNFKLMSIPLRQGSAPVLIDVNASFQLYVHKEANISKYSKICFPPHSVLKLLAYALVTYFLLLHHFELFSPCQ